MPLTHENRLIATDTPLGPDVLLLRGFTGHESLPRLSAASLVRHYGYEGRSDPMK